MVVSSGDVSAGMCGGTEFGEACHRRRLWRQARPRARQTGPHTGKKAGLESKLLITQKLVGELENSKAYYHFLSFLY